MPQRSVGRALVLGTAAIARTDIDPEAVNRRVVRTGRAPRSLRTYQVTAGTAPAPATVVACVDVDRIEPTEEPGPGTGEPASSSIGPAPPPA